MAFISNIFGVRVLKAEHDGFPASQDSYVLSGLHRPCVFGQTYGATLKSSRPYLPKSYGQLNPLRT